MKSISVMGQTVSVEDIRPLRKSKALVLEDTVGNHSVLAYFRDDDSAKIMEIWLDRLANLIDKGSKK